MRRMKPLIANLLQRHSITGPPVPIDDIAHALGIEVHMVSTDDQVSGALVRSGARVVIAVNPDHHPNRQRFTIAHEIGHFCLHDSEPLHVDQDFRVSWRDENSSRAVDWKEIEANQFAAELLMPAQFVEDDLRSLAEFDTSVVAWLAHRYMVSKQAMEIRLANLGVIAAPMIFE